MGDIPSFLRPPQFSAESRLIQNCETTQKTHEINESQYVREVIGGLTTPR
jgi:hypothetical protein